MGALSQRATRKVRALMASAGLEVPEVVTVERTYAGRNQRSIGWVVWIALDERGRVVCGSGWPIRDLRAGQVCVHRRDPDGTPEIGPVGPGSL